MSRTRRTATAVTGAAIAALLAPAAASAHGIAQRADLPIPEWLFAWGAALVLLASFAALAVLWPRPVLAGLRDRVLLGVPRVFEILAGVLGIAAFAITVYAGLAGNQTATANLAPTMVFVLFWVGIPVLSACVGDVFAAVSPWRATGRAVGWVAQRVAGGGGLPAPMTYPERLGRWPAAAGIFLFAWVELAYVNRDHPQTLAILALVYAAVMLVGMSLYGVEAWVRNADAFGVAFGLIALLAPLRWGEGRVRLQWPLAGAIRMPQIAGGSAVVLTMIGTTSFDGFSQGALWSGGDGISERLASTFGDLGLGRELAVQAGYTVGLLAIVLLVAGLYRLGVAGMHSVSGPDGPSSAELSRRFAHALIPIAFAYLVAHYFSLLAFQGQAITFLISDPLGDGSDLFGTASATIDYAIVGANAIWYVQVAALIVGHVGGLALAHDRALEIWNDPRTATRSQYWMLLVMVTFTCFGLWILSAGAA